MPIGQSGLIRVLPVHVVGVVGVEDVVDVPSSQIVYCIMQSMTLIKFKKIDE